MTAAPMDIAARIALRGHGAAEPNPLVGCVITTEAGVVVGTGHHQRCGGAHAEVNALAAAGDRARGGTAYVTLEPCAHTGRTGPCTEALHAAGIARVVCARRDPNPVSSGGTEWLRERGIPVEFVEHAAARRVSDAFACRIEQHRPWVTAKWAQSIDGRIATRTGHSQWISGAASRRLVHRERGRCEAILTAIGTVRADDPQLTARDVRCRRTAARVIIDPALELPLDSKLVATVDAAPVIVYAEAERLQSPAAAALRGRGIDVRGAAVCAGDLDLGEVLRDLAATDDISNVLVEAGAGLLSRLHAAELIDDIWVFIAPLLLADDAALPPMRGSVITEMHDALRAEPLSMHRRGDDVVMRLRVRST